MERVKAKWFFFASATERYNTLNEFIASRFRHLYGSEQKNKQDTLGKHFYDVIREGQELRFLQDHRLATEYGYDLDGLSKITVYEYHLLLEDYDRQIKAANSKINESASSY